MFFTVRYLNLMNKSAEFCGCIVVEIGGMMKDLLFGCLMYLYHEVICLYRCLCGKHCICTGLIFAVTDAFFETDVSATYFSLNLQILFSLPDVYNCIYILPFLKPEDASFANFASTSHVFDNVRMFLIEIMHPHLALSITCGYISQKLSQYITYKKIYALMCLSLMESEQEFLY